jgi:hypothetical protein
MRYDVVMTHVIAPRDIFETRNGIAVRVHSKGDRLTVEEAKKYKVLPISVASFANIETK